MSTLRNWTDLPSAVRAGVRARERPAWWVGKPLPDSPDGFGRITDLQWSRFTRWVNGDSYDWIAAVDGVTPNRVRECIRYVAYKLARAWREEQEAIVAGGRGGGSMKYGPYEIVFTLDPTRPELGEAILEFIRTYAGDRTGVSVVARFSVSDFDEPVVSHPAPPGS